MSSIGGITCSLQQRTTQRIDSIFFRYSNPVKSKYYNKEYFVNSHMKELHVTSKKRNEMIDITTQVQHVVEEEHVTEGIVIIYVPHTTAGITINEGADPSVQQDIIRTLERLVPESRDYAHSEGNSDAHIKASLLGSSVTILVQKRKLRLGTWQHVFFYEGDGPRQRTVLVHVSPQ
jgi:secondary thiamine-phosphate synthase enzyme